MPDRLPSAQTVRAELLQLLGLVPVPPSLPELRATQEFGNWLLEDRAFRSTDGEPIPAWFLRPRETRDPVPAVLYCHAHGGRYAFGRDELTEGRRALVGPYASDLRDLGCAVLCMEMPGFGARQVPGKSARAKAHLWRGTTPLGQMMAELAAGLDFLERHEAVDSQRIATLGLSMGCTHAWWLAALDTRVRAASGLCCLADMDALIRSGAHDLHGIYMTVPGLTSTYRTGQIAGLVAPRAQQVCVGVADPLTPPNAFAIARRDLESAYAHAGAPERLSFHIEPDSGHVETPAMRAAVLGFLREHLLEG